MPTATITSFPQQRSRTSVANKTEQPAEPEDAALGQVVIKGKIIGSGKAEEKVTLI